MGRCRRPLPVVASTGASSCARVARPRTRRSRLRASGHGRPSSAGSARMPQGGWSRTSSRRPASSRCSPATRARDGLRRRRRRHGGRRRPRRERAARTGRLPELLQARAVLVSGYSLLQPGPEAAARAALERRADGLARRRRGVGAPRRGLWRRSLLRGDGHGRRPARERRGGARADRPRARGRRRSSSHGAFGSPASSSEAQARSLRPQATTAARRGAADRITSTHWAPETRSQPGSCSPWPAVPSLLQRCRPAATWRRPRSRSGPPRLLPWPDVGRAVGLAVGDDTRARCLERGKRRLPEL